VGRYYKDSEYAARKDCVCVKDWNEFKEGVGYQYKDAYSSYDVLLGSFNGRCFTVDTFNKHFKIIDVNGNKLAEDKFWDSPVYSDKEANKIMDEIIGIVKENDMTLDEQIAVIQAKKEGIAVELSLLHFDGTYGTMASIEDFDFSSYKYRIKSTPEPEPLTFSEDIKFIREHPGYEMFDGNLITFFSGICYSENSEQIWQENIEDLKWREAPGKEWKEFVK